MKATGIRTSPGRLIRCVLASMSFLFVFAWGPVLAGYDAKPSRDVDLSGHWVLNHRLSEDAEAMLARRLEQERSRLLKQRRAFEQAHTPGAVPPIDVYPAAGASQSRSSQRPWQKRRDDNLRRMLGITRMLTIHQSGRRIEIESEQETRRFEAGTRSQISMPQGQLADARVGWKGQSFVVDRRVKRGPGVVEKFRLLSKTGQLEYQMAWSGETELSGMKVRRVFDRATHGTEQHDGSIRGTTGMQPADDTPRGAASIGRDQPPALE